MDDSIMKHVLNNIFLPLELPQEEDQSGAEGGTFVRLVADVLSEMVSSVEALKETRRMMKSWGTVQQNFMESKSVQQNIEALRPGETCALFLPMQNAGLTISLDHTLAITLAVFRVAASSSEVMSAPGALVGTFPSWSVTTKADRVRNPSFAKQVADLANNQFEDTLPQTRKAGASHGEERDVVDAKYVTEWLLGSVAGHSLITGEAGVKRVQKKICDEVLWKRDSRLPWRRSGEYMAVKIVPHSTLVGSLGELDGVIAYKLVMLKVMSTFLRRNFAKLDTDVILQMLSKVARRISKLDELAKQTPTMNLSLHHCVQRNLQEICKLVIDVRGNVDERWRSIMQQETEDSDVSVDKSKLEFARDLSHSFRTALPHLRVALSPTSQPCNPSLYDPSCARRNTSRSWPDLNLLHVNSYEALHDIEVWVRDVLFVELNDNTDRPATKLFKLMRMYIDRAKVFYKGDCLGSSRRILTVITMVAVLDRLAGREFPLLLAYDPGVDTTVLELLLLLHRHDMEHLSKLEAYFARRVENRSLAISLISEDVPSPQSFSVRQAQRDPEVQKRKEEILGFSRQEKREKQEELARARQKHANLVRTAAARSCDMFTNRYGYEFHSGYCKKCALSSEAAKMRVGVFEFPLPEMEHLQDAVVCELVAATSSWAILRDALHVLHRDLLSVQLASCENKGTWRDYAPLQRWVRTPGEQPLITFGSTSKLFVNSHYRSLNPGSYSDDSFFKPNGFNLQLMEYSGGKLAGRTTYKKSGDVRSVTTLDADGAYKCLQWTMGGTSHTENQVLCRLVDCPSELNLAEFHAFGTLRAGQRLQIRNIVRVLEMQTLSLSQPSVVNLLSQVLWETGPPNETVWFRDSQLDLREEAFARYTLNRLLSLTRNIGDNWKDHLALLSIVTIGARVLAMSEPAWEMAAIDILRNCREIAAKWLAQIEVVLGGMMASPITEIQKMRSKLVDVAAISALTFDVDVRHLELAMASNEDVIHWLRAVARIHNNVLLSNSETSVRSFQWNLLRRVQLTALRAEKTLDRHLEDDDDCLDGFVRHHWADATQGHTESWECYESPCEHWWTTTFKRFSDGHESTLHVDTLRGAFLVNGLPVGRLPSAITSHEDYARVFGDHVFEVQPAAGSAGTFVSVYKLKDSVFTFALVDNRLVVKDRRHDNYEYELLPSRFLSGDLPRLLTEQYSHWIVQTDSICTPADVRILFRPVKFDDDHFADDVVPHEIISRGVRDNQRDRNLVDIRSGSFKEIYDRVLYRLESPSYVHVFVTLLGDVHAELPRMGLSFLIKEGVLWSREQPGFRVSTQQSLGTLIGLQQGVLLIEGELLSGKHIDIPCKRSLIMPHAMALSSKMQKRRDSGKLLHPVVGIEEFQLSSPSFFVYDVDDRLQSLRAPASQAAWLYLALLHALTAHPLPDPFTGLTGAESAMRLLQSPRCWSCQPYDANSHSILLHIAKLCPRRSWYPEHLECMQTVRWPAGLFSSTALDAFRMVVEKLIEGSQRLSVLFPSLNHQLLPTLSKESSTLRLKSYWRSRNFLGPEALMSSKFEGAGPPVAKFTTMNLSRQEGEKLRELYRRMRTLAEGGFEWRSGRCESSFGDHLRSTLLDCKSLRGATREEFRTMQTVSAWRKYIAGEIADNWINLYNLARRVSVQGRRAEFTFLLSLLAFRDVDYQLLFLLLFVAVHADEFKSIDPPEYESYEFTDEAVLDLSKVEMEVECHKVSFDDWKFQSKDAELLKQNHRPWYTESLDDQLLKKYRQRQIQDVVSWLASAQRSWPSTISSSLVTSAATIDCSKALDGVCKLFTRWLHNIQLHIFVSRVNAKIDELAHRATVALKPGPLELPSQSHSNAASNITPFCYYKIPIARRLKLSSEESSEAEAIFQAGQFGRSLIENSKQEALERHESPHPSFLEANRNSSCQVSELFKADLRNSWDQRHKLHLNPVVGVHSKHLAAKLRECKMKSISFWNGIRDAVMPSEEDLPSRALEAAGLWRRITPGVLLPLLVISLENFADRVPRSVHPSVRMALGAVAVIWTLEQQAERCLRFLGSANDVALQKELANATSPRNWKPIDRPEWLLLELEGDYMMRKVQVDVTNAMLEPQDAQNAVLQLNMGEGKTSVIVPALCASISDGKQFARLTVLSSLFRINFDALAFKLGGLLNRRVYTFPCSRDMKLSVEEVERMMTAYLKCIGERGVVVTRPEHRLSAQLMALELCRAGLEPGRKLRKLLEYVNAKAGDVLDESDLILQVKYQVVYTIGEQMNIDGGNLRWKLSQSVLHSARSHFHSLLVQFGSDAIEFKDAEEGHSAFPHVRLLNEDLYMSLCESILDDVLDGKDEDLAIPELPRHQKMVIRTFVLDSTVSMEAIQGVVPERRLLQIVVIMRGLLCYGVLMHALRMRWRVEFGVRPSGHPKMAVPFRAKDVPVERAEYGHPDVAIMLTQLSYYNSGLSDEQLLQAFERLNRLSTRDYEYKRWLQDAPEGRLPENLSDVNLDDFVERKRKLFPLLRRNMRVIDFWLSTTVFPVECKQFEGKLVASAWDLCERHAKRPVCGFSGTKDTSLLLPISIRQHDLPQLQGTDGVVIANLLQEENRRYQNLPSYIDGVGILKKVNQYEVKGYKARVLLDVGTLMVDLSNREVATTWLALIPRGIVEAAIYFDNRDNQIMAVDRDGHEAPLPLSQYHKKMESCVVYLDDVHTRGTDLKIPPGYHACVTLGRGITKDTLVQACMRMRMLGAGHSVSFWASHEVHTSILSALSPSLDRKLTSEDVLAWVTQNSVKAIKDWFRHWGAQGITHCRRQTVNQLYAAASKGEMSLQTLGVLNTQREIVDLVQCYGNERRATPLPEIVSNWLRNAAGSMTGDESAKIMMSLGSPILDRIREYAASVQCCAQVLDEEQERELEHELEEEEEIKRPGAATPHTPQISFDVRVLASGWFNSGSKEFLPALQALQCMSLWQDAELAAWSTKLYVTREFATMVAENSLSSGVEFLRPVAWVVVVHSKWSQSVEPEAVVLLSSFEANSLLPEFRSGNGTQARLHMIAPRLREGQDLMLREQALVLPIASSTEAMNVNRLPPRLPVVAQVLAFSGNVFFASKSEESAYCEFLGLCPRPRCEAEEDAFHRGDIDRDGFVVPEKRDLIQPRLKTACGFKASPVGFMAELLAARGWHGYPSSSHVGQILFLGRRASNLPDEPEDGSPHASQQVQKFAIRALTEEQKQLMFDQFQKMLDALRECSNSLKEKRSSLD